MKKSIIWIFLLITFLTINMEVKAAGSNSSIAGSGSGGGGADCWAHGCRTYGVAGIRVSIVNGKGSKIGTTLDYYGTNIGAQWNSGTHYYVSSRSIKSGSHASVSTGAFSAITAGNSISNLPGSAPSLNGGYSNKSLSSINFSSVASYFNSLSTSFNQVAQSCKDAAACKASLKKTTMYALLKKHGISDTNATNCEYLKDVYILVEPISMVVIGNDAGTSGTNGSLAKYFIGTSTEIAYIVKNPSKVKAKATHVEGIAIGTIGGYITMPNTLEGFYLNPVSGTATASDLLNNTSGYGAGALYVWDKGIDCPPEKVYCKLNATGTKLLSIGENGEEKKDPKLCCNINNYEFGKQSEKDLKESKWYKDFPCEEPTPPPPLCNLSNLTDPQCCNMTSVDGEYNYSEEDRNKIGGTTQVKLDQYLKKNHSTFYKKYCEQEIESKCKVENIGEYSKKGQLTCCSIKTGSTDNYKKEDLRNILGSIITQAKFDEYLKKNHKDYYDQCHKEDKKYCSLTLTDKYIESDDKTCCSVTEYDPDVMKNAIGNAGLIGGVTQDNFLELISGRYSEFYNFCQGGGGDNPNPPGESDSRQCLFNPSTDCPNCNMTGSTGIIGDIISGEHDPKYCILTHGQYREIKYEYCEIYCKPTAEYSLPNKGFSIAGGQHFTLGGQGLFSPITMNIKKECYAQIHTQKFVNDLIDKNVTYENFYNDYQEIIKNYETLLNNGVAYEIGSPSKTPECGYANNISGTAVDPKGVSHRYNFSHCTAYGFDAHWVYPSCYEVPIVTPEGETTTTVCPSPYISYYTVSCANNDYTGREYFVGGDFEYSVLANTVSNMIKYPDKVAKGTAKKMCTTEKKSKEELEQEYRDKIDKAKESLEHLKTSNPAGTIITDFKRCEAWIQDKSFIDRKVNPNISFETNGLNYAYSGDLNKTFSDTITPKYYVDNGAFYFKEPMAGASYLIETERINMSQMAYILEPKEGGGSEVQWVFIPNLLKNDAIGATFERTFTYNLPWNTYNYIDKVTSIPSHTKPNGTNYVMIPYGNIPIALDQEVGTYDISLTINSFGATERNLNRYLEQGKVSGCEYKDTCQMNVGQDIQIDPPGANQSYLDVVYRPISLKNPFIVQNLNRNNQGKTGENWCDKEDCSSNNATVSKYITNNRGASSEDLYKKEPMYKITLTTARILEIRKYNNTTTYDDFNLTCNGENGKECKSTFIRNSNYQSYFASTCGINGDWNACDKMDGIKR